MILAVEVTTTWYLVLGAVLFTLGGVGLLLRRNVLVMFMCVELMLNAVNLTFVAFGRDLGDIGGQVSVFFVLVVAAAEVVIGLALIVAVLRRRRAGEQHREAGPVPLHPLPAGLRNDLGAARHRRDRRRRARPPLEGCGGP